MKNSSNSHKAINLVFCDPAVRRLAVSSPKVGNANIFSAGLQVHTSTQENWWWHNGKRSAVGMV